MNDCLVNLCKSTIVADEIGNQTETLLKNEVFAELRSITQNEFFAAQTAGLTPEYKFLVTIHDWNGESLLEYDGDIYHIYRTYVRSDSEQIELYTERRVGDG